MWEHYSWAIKGQTRLFQCTEITQNVQQWEQIVEEDKVTQNCLIMFGQWRIDKHILSQTVKSIYIHIQSVSCFREIFCYRTVLVPHLTLLQSIFFLPVCITEMPICSLQCFTERWDWSDGLLDVSEWQTHANPHHAPHTASSHEFASR